MFGSAKKGGWIKGGFWCPGVKTKKQKSVTKVHIRARIWTKIGVTPTIFRAGSDFAGPGAQKPNQKVQKNRKTSNPPPLHPSLGLVRGVCSIGALQRVFNVFVLPFWTIFEHSWVFGAVFRISGANFGFPRRCLGFRGGFGVIVGFPGRFFGPCLTPRKPPKGQKWSKKGHTWSKMVRNRSKLVQSCPKRVPKPL